MTDKVRAALFDTLGDISGLSVLDTYAGSGALGIEALSRGASKVEAVELGDTAAKTIRRNVQSLQIGIEYVLHQMRVESWLARQPEGGYGIIFFMPPYAAFDSELLERTAALLVPDGILVLEHPSRSQVPSFAGLPTVMQRRYGDATLAYYQMPEEP